jgi:hypothetical protein
MTKSFKEKFNIVHRSLLSVRKTQLRSTTTHHKPRQGKNQLI